MKSVGVGRARRGSGEIVLIPFGGDELRVFRFGIWALWGGVIPLIWKAAYSSVC